MNVRSALPALPVALPRVLVQVAGRHGRSAIANARAAAASVSTAVAERTELTRSLTDDRDGDHALHLLPESECRRLLALHSVGRLAYVARAAVPEIVPVAYAYDGSDVLIRSGPGPKLQAAERGERVAFEIDDLDVEARTGWSVVVHGTATRLRRSDAERLDVAPEPWADGPRNAVIRIRPSRITGRRLG